MGSNLTPSNLDYRQLYSLEDPLAKMPYRMHRRLIEYWPTQEQQHALVRGKYRPAGALIFDAKHGSKAMDILWSTSVSCFFFSNRLTKLLTNHYVTGWDTYAVELYDRQGYLLTDYRGVAVTGAVCRRDRSRSEIVYRPSPANPEKSYPYYRGLYFHEADWDGSDMFWISEGGGLIVTAKVFHILNQHKIRNVKLTQLTDVELDVGNDKYAKPPSA